MSFQAARSSSERSHPRSTRHITIGKVTLTNLIRRLTQRQLGTLNEAVKLIGRT